MFRLIKFGIQYIFDTVNIYRKRLLISGGVSAFKGVAERFKEMFN